MNRGQQIYEDLGGSVFERTACVSGIFFNEEYFQCFVSRNVFFRIKYIADDWYEITLSQFTAKAHKFEVKKIQTGKYKPSEFASIFTYMTGRLTKL
jgi:hypothetical protein